MVVGETLLTTLTTGILRYVSQNKQQANLYIYFAKFWHNREKYRLVWFIIIFAYVYILGKWWRGVLENHK